MMCHPLRLFGLTLLVTIAIPATIGAQAEPRHRFGLAVGAAVGGAPLGEIAERNGTFAILGKEYEIRALMRGPGGTEWSLGFLFDDYRLDQEIDLTTRSKFEYSSTGLVVGFSRSGVESSVPIRHGMDIGWRRFDVSSSGPSYYTGSPKRVVPMGTPSCSVYRWVWRFRASRSPLYRGYDSRRTIRTSAVETGTACCTGSMMSASAPRSGWG